MLVKTFLIAGVPWIALSVAVTFSLYAVARKRLQIDPILGLFVETLILLPLTLGRALEEVGSMSRRTNLKLGQFEDVYAPQRKAKMLPLPTRQSMAHQQ